MTSPSGGGGANLGTVTGKVRISYESSNVARATRDVNNFQSSLVAAGDAGAASAKGVSQATAAVGRLQTATGKLSKTQVLNPLAGMSAAVAKETSMAQGTITKAMADFQKSVVKGMNVTAPVRITPRDVTIDRGSFTKAIEEWKRTGGKQLNMTTLTGSIKYNPNVAVDTAGATKAGRQWKQAFDRAAASSGPVSAGSLTGAGGSAGGGGSGLASALPLLSKVTLAAGAATAAVGGVGYVLTKGFQRLSSLDEAATKLKALGYSAKQIEGISKSALDAVDKTSYGLDEAFATAASAIASGIKPGADLTGYLKMVADNAALAGMGMQEMGYIFGKVANTGKLQGDEMNIFMERNIDVVGNLSKHLGIARSSVKQMVTDGKIDFATFSAAMNANAGAAVTMGNSMSGSFKNLGASISRAGAALLAPLFGKATGEAGPLTLAVQKITEGVNWLGQAIKDNQGGIVTFWEVLGKGGLIAAKAFVSVVSFISDSVVKVTEIVGDLTGWLSTAFGKVAGLLGASGMAQEAQEFADSMHDLGSGLRENRDINMGKLNRGLDTGWAALEKWADGARNASNSGGELADSTGAATPQVLGLKDALEALQIKADAAETALMGTNEQFAEFLDSVRDKGGTDALIASLQQVRDRFENGGRQVKAFADAIDKMKDSTASASDKADALISSLQGLGLLPGGDALASYNEAFDKMTSHMSTIIDLSDTMGNALAKSDGTLDLNSGNARNLLGEIQNIRKEMVQLVASGEASPDEAYERTVAGLNQLLQGQAGISPDVAQKIIDTYLPKGAILDSLKAQNPKQALESIFKDDPAKLQSELNLLTTTEDILGQIVGADGALHVPTVLDAKPPASAPAAPATPPAGTGTGAPKLGPDMQLKPGATPFTGPLAPGTESGFVTAPDGSVWKKEDWTARPPAVTAPAQGPAAKPPPATIAPTDLGGLLGTPETSLRDDSAARQQFLDLAGNKEALAKALAENPDIANQLDSLVDQANAQGENMGVAFAQGLMNGTPEVKAALLELASLAGDYLGNSPARYGPLSGKGWTLFRGKTFTTDWAKGITSEAGAVASAGESVAGSAVGGLGGGGVTLNDSVTQLLGDLQQFSDFGKMILEFGNQLAGVAFTAGKLFNDLSGGKLFPKSYTQDPEFDGRRGSVLGGWNPTQNKSMMPGLNGQPGTGGYQGATGAGQIPLVQNPDGTWTSSNPEWAKLIARESGGNPQIVQGVQDANSGGNEATGLFQIAKGTWESNGGTAFAPNAKDATPQQQAEIAAKIFAAQGGSPWGSGANQNFGREDEGLLRAGLTTGAAMPEPGPLTTPGKVLSEKFGAFEPGGAVPGVAAARVKDGMVDGYAVTPDGKGGYTFATQAPTPAAGVAQYNQQSGDAGAARTPYGLASGTDTGGYGTGNAGTFPPWVMALSKQFDVLPSTYSEHQETDRHEAGFAPNPEHLNRGIDWSSGNVDNMQRFADYLATIPGALEQVIWRNPNTGATTEVAGGATTPGYYPEGTLAGHENHVHTRQSLSIPLPGQMPGAFTQGTAQGSQGMPVTLTGQANDALAGIWNNTNGMPSMPGQLQELIAGDSVLSDAMRNQGSLTKDSVVPVLQQLDTRIAEQNKIGTPQSKALSDSLGGYKNQLAGQFGMKEGPSALDQAETVYGGVSGVASDVFAAFDAGLKYLGALHDTGNILVRGISNTEDVMKLIDNFQTGLDFAAKIFQAAGGIASFAGSMSGGADMGGASAAGGMLQMVGQVIQVVNTGIDIAQEAYKITSKYVGRFIQAWTGLTGASDVRYLLDEYTGQVAAYSSDNPADKKWMNTLPRALGKEYPDARPAPTNNFVIYQGPGQDPRDTMDDAMFTVRQSGQGVFGYDAV